MLKNARRFTPVIAIALAIAPRLAAQQSAAPMEKVTFDQAVQRAIDHNPTVAEAGTAIVRAEALLQQSRAVTRPSVSASLTNVTLDNARGFSGGVFQPQNQSTIGVDLGVPVLAASRWAATNQARDQVDVARLSATDVRRQIAVAAAQAYLAVIAQKRQVDVNERARDAAKAHLDYASKRLASGAAPVSMRCAPPRRSQPTKRGSRTRGSRFVARKKRLACSSRPAVQSTPATTQCSRRRTFRTRAPGWPRGPTFNG